MKRKIVAMISGIVSVLSAAIVCGCSVTACAWVRLEADGYVYYSTSMYASGGDHIYYYEKEEDAADDAYHTNCALTVVFYPRILGPAEVDGVKTTTVDLSDKYYSMTVYIYKSKATYSPDKSVYLNGAVLEPENVYETDNLLSLSFENFGLERGNPGGRLNGKINVIEYK